MADFEEIKSSLQADKPTIRKKGKVLLEDDIIRKKIALTPYQTMNLIFAVMIYEKKEIEALKDKNKPITHDASQLFRHFIRYTCKYGQIISSKMLELIENTLDILYDGSLPNTVKNIHKTILCELLDTKYAFSIPFESKRKQTGWKKLFIYLKEIMVDKKSACDPLSLKLLKGICGNLYNDFHFQPVNDRKSLRTEFENLEAISAKQILLPLLDWFKGLMKYVDEKDEGSVLLLTTLFDSCSSLVQHYEVNIINLLLGTRYIEDFLGLASKYLFLIHSIQEKYMDSINYFLFIFFSSFNTQLLPRFLDTHLSKAEIVESNRIISRSFDNLGSFYFSLRILYEEIISDDYLINLLSTTRKRNVQHSRGKGSSFLVPKPSINVQSNLFVDALEEIGTFKLSLQAAYQIIVGYVEVWNHLLNESGDFLFSPNFIRKEEDSDDVAHAIKRNRKDNENNTVYNIGIFKLFKKLELIHFTTEKMENAKTFPFGQEGGKPTRKFTSDLNPLGNKFILVESILWLIIHYLEQSEMDFLFYYSPRFLTTDRISIYCSWVSILFTQLNKVLQFKEEKQLIGTFFRALSLLLERLGKLTSSSPSPQDRIINELNSILIQLSVCLVENEKNFFQVVNNRFINLSPFHSEVFRLCSIILNYYLTQGTSFSYFERFCTSLLKWKVFQIRSSKRENTITSEEETVPVENLPELQELPSTSIYSENLTCPYFLQLLLMFSFASNNLLKKTEGFPCLNLNTWLHTFLFQASRNLNYSNIHLARKESYLLLLTYKLFLYSSFSSFSSYHPVPTFTGDTGNDSLLRNWYISKDLHWFVQVREWIPYTQNVLLKELLPRSEADEESFANLGNLWIVNMESFQTNNASNRENLILFYQLGTFIMLGIGAYPVQSVNSRDLLFSMIVKLLNSIEVKLTILLENVKELNSVLSGILYLKPFSELNADQFDIITSSFFRILDLVKLRYTQTSNDFNNNGNVFFDEDFEEIRVGSNETSEWNSVNKTKLSNNQSSNSGLTSLNQTSYDSNLLDSLDFILYFFKLLLNISFPTFSSEKTLDMEPRWETLNEKLSTFLLQYLHLSVRDSKYSEAELALLICEKYSILFEKNYNFIMNLIQLISWKKILFEWEHFAYLKVLQIFQIILPKKSFWKENNRLILFFNNRFGEDSFLSFIIEKMFPGESEDENATPSSDDLEAIMLRDHWFLRKVQLENTIIILKSVDELPRSLKTNITSIFLSGLQDLDFRVRRLSCLYFNLLFSHFKNPLKVYKNSFQTLYDSFKNQLDSEANETDFVEVSFIFQFCANILGNMTIFTSSYSSLFAHEMILLVLKDLIEVSFSKINTVVGGQRMIYREFLLLTMNIIAKVLRYPNRKSFMLDHLQYLLYIWEVCMTKSLIGTQQLDLPTQLKLNDFPFELLYEDYGLMTFVRRSELFSSFLVDYSHFIIASFTDHNSSRIRWLFFTSYCSLMYGSDSDNELNRLFSTHFITCKSLEMLSHVKLQFSQNLLGSNHPFVQELSVFHTDLSKFFNRVLSNQKDAVSLMKKDITSFINFFISFATFNSEKDKDPVLYLLSGSVEGSSRKDFNLSDNTSASVLTRGYLVGLLQYLCQFLDFPSLEQMFQATNQHFILSNIFDRFKTSNSLLKGYYALNYLLVLIESTNFSIDQRILCNEIWKFLLYVIFSLVKLLDEEAISVEVVIELFTLLIETNLAFQRKLGSSIHLLSSKLKISAVKDNLYSLLFFLLILQQLNQGLTLSSFSKGTSPLCEVISYLIIFPEDLSPLLKRTKGHFTDILQKLKNVLNSWLVFLSKDIGLVPHFLLGIPSLFDSSLGNVQKDGISSYSSSSSALSYCQDTIRESCLSILNGLDCWPTLFLSLIALEENLEKESLNNSNSGGKSFSWEQDSGSSQTIESKFPQGFQIAHDLIPILLAVCNSVDTIQQHFSILNCWPMNHLPTLIGNVINKLKYFSISWSANPSKGNISISYGASLVESGQALCRFYPLANPIKSTSYETMKLQKAIVLLTYKMLWKSHLFKSNAEDIETFPVASNALNSLAVQTYFQEDNNSGTANSSDESPTSNMTTSFDGSNSQPGEMVYDSISFLFSRFPTTQNCLNKYNAFKDAAFNYQLFDGDHDLFTAFVNDSIGQLWNENLWRLNRAQEVYRRKPYSNWIKRISYSFVQSFLQLFKSNQTSKSSGKSKSKQSNSAGNNKLIFLLSCAFPLSLHSVEIGEILFILAVGEAIDTFSCQSEFISRLFNYIKKFIIISEDPTIPGNLENKFHYHQESKQLVGHLFCYLLQKCLVLQPLTINEIGEFQLLPGAKATRQTKELLYNRYSKFFTSAISLFDIAKSLFSVNLLTSALLFSELVAEKLDVCSLFELQQKYYQLQPLVSQPINYSQDLQNDSSLYSSLLDFFQNLYQVIDDPDYIEALDRSFNLSLQGICYDRKGQHFEALCTYESIYHINNPQFIANTLGGKSRMASQSVSNGITAALQGLGASHTASFYNAEFLKYQEQLNNANLNSQSELSLWKLGPQEDYQSTDRTNFTIYFQTKKSNSSDHSQKGFSGLLQSILPQYTSSLSRISKLLNYESNKSIEMELMKLYDSSLVWNLHRLNSSRLSDNSIPNKIGSLIKSSIHENRITGFQRGTEFIKQLLSAEIISPIDALYSLKSIEEKIVSPTLNHAISPFLYRCWDEIYSCISKSSNGKELQRTANLILQETEIVISFVQLQECKLLWKKGATDSALERLNTVVLPRLLEMSRKFQSISVQKSKKTVEINPLISVGSDLYSETLRLNGLWTSQKGARASNEILKSNLEPSLQYAVSDENKIQSYIALANFTSTLFHNIQARIQSIEWIQAERVFKDREEELKLCLELQQQQNPNSNKANPTTNQAAVVQENRNLLRHIVMLKKEIEMDKKERNHLLQSYNNYLILSIEYYLKILFLSKDPDIEIVFRFINLWFRNNQNALNTTTTATTTSITLNTQAMNDLISSYMKEKKLLSYKFVSLHYQIFSRLGSSSSETSNLQTSTNQDSFQRVLQEFITMLCLDHPHHVAPQLFALIHEKTVDSITFKSNNQGVRCILAENILKTLLSQATHQNSTLIKNIQVMLESYHELAKTSTEQFQNNGKTKNIKFKEIQPKGKRFNEIFTLFSGNQIPNIITLSIPINPMKVYESNYNLIRVKEIVPVFHITENGISRPKIVSVLGENGIYYKQLVKGGDDMRQDAVMEQVFENINYTLLRDSETSRRNLIIRTYKVIPLTPQTGILQWVENTLPFGAILCDRVNGLHTRYQKSVSDYSHKECREILQKCTDNQDKEVKFQEIMQHFHPVFHYFFIEKFSSNPMEWFMKRNNYVKSVATNSMTGFVLGIGDRHAHNILIDQISGECVHIDFGIVFDQGKGLGTPETVPFRLTRDIVDGMGVNGIEGPFRRCSEEVLRVLRENSFNLLTILEVVIYDPLYKWSLSPLKARNKQMVDNANANETGVNNQDNGKVNNDQVPDFHENILQRRRNVRNTAANINNPGNDTTTTKAPQTNFGKDAAERTLMKIRNKLRGYEDLSFDALDVPGHVDMLINEAKDPSNLCKIFPGWAPWL